MKVWRNLSPNGRVVAGTVGTVLAMGSLGWAAVPLYDIFCAVTGYGGTTTRAEADATEVLDRTVLVRFDASKEKDMPWTFKPVQKTMRVRIGETNLAFYEATNPTDRPVAGTAAYNVAPYAAGPHFTKIACFCFEEQVLAPGETVSMPVTFYVDPAIVDDPEASGIPEITLSYTFYVSDLPQDHAALYNDAAVTTN
ncbi:cytochrome c oxidase assembly protein [Jannaschia rubra]|uniref:Cytochrome c oxidase assembly protein CtaG n=1 Tax=Jannaschia rubra TaxID=282197 RepID=A0A0M6XLR3_9RHOB|nr:cytochrome c oxidase assembly protein [Jannaschia rubra]CTQ31507.1 Cytochrome c oxidase assembly protein CtaG [Jannaschia rubra]SFF78147.1 cytochrome c oxidase assembly protein subunit 11 [Jannaschia rubra]